MPTTQYPVCLKLSCACAPQPSGRLTRNSAKLGDFVGARREADHRGMS
jgi:hypothetical protein